MKHFLGTPYWQLKLPTAINGLMMFTVLFDVVYCFIALSQEMQTYRHIAIKNETSAKHLRQISKRNSIILCKAQY